jgi:hypothetical protein
VRLGVLPSQLLEADVTGAEAEVPMIRAAQMILMMEETALIPRWQAQ